jgi:putative transposase
MARQKKHVVSLSEEQQAQLKQLVSKGQASARVIRRAHALLLASKDKTDEAVAEALQLSKSSVYQLRRRFCEQGLEAALYDKPRPGAALKLDGKQEALLVALACSEPEQRETWTMQLLADKLVELGVVESISDETIRRRLKKTRSSRGKSSSGASAR